jgi:hypothetical protein
VHYIKQLHDGGTVITDGDMALQMTSQRAQLKAFATWGQSRSAGQITGTQHLAPGQELMLKWLEYLTMSFCV